MTHPAIPWLVGRLAEMPAVRRVLLFGSRARGDHGPRSDIDLAVDAPGASVADRARLAELVEDAPALVGIDLVRLDQVDGRLRRAIESQGIVLLERDQTGAGGRQSRARPVGAGAGARRRRW
ncbi:MAG: nucleotidyltransferase family protein [Geminicoccaceae bacterium]